MSRLLILEPYHGGSHASLCDGLAARYPGEVRLLSLPARKWKWRMRGSALHFARQLLDDPWPADCWLVSSMTNLAELCGLIPTHRPARVVLYCHENQLAYPVRHPDERDFQFALTQATSALAADAVGFNSAWNRDSFLTGLDDMLRRMPQPKERWVVEAIRRRSAVLGVPIHPLAAGEKREPPLILWNHRWEHDKDPDAFAAAILSLADGGADFRVALCGQRFDWDPPGFLDMRERLGARLVGWGNLPRSGYESLVRESAIVVSTARHEFLGLSVLEAVSAGCLPLVPDALVYPELYPDCCRYRTGTELIGRLAWALRERPRLELDALWQRYTWPRLLPRYLELLAPTNGQGDAVLPTSPC